MANTSQSKSINNNASKPIVWTIAGSDSGGGAGIQADLATIVDLDCHPCTLITAITAQNTVAVTRVASVSEQDFTAQLDALLADLAPSVIKIGLLTEQSQVSAIANMLAKVNSKESKTKTVPVILDPVMVASCGDALASSLDFSPLKGLITLITPNQHELARLVDDNYRPLLQLNLSKLSQIEQDALTLGRLLDCHVLVTGGDALSGEQVGLETSRNTPKAQDVYVTRFVAGASVDHNDKTFVLSSPMLDGSNNHGTGCTLSSAVACFLAHGLVLHDAVVLAKAYVNKGLANGYAKGAGKGCLARTGWPHDLTLMPSVDLLNQSMPTVEFAELPQVMDVYPVVDDIKLLENLCRAGCNTVQLRLKSQALPNTDAYDVEQQSFEKQIIRAVRIGRDTNSQVFINDHWQLALKHGAFGVHLGQEDVATADLEALANAGVALGLSSHSYFEILLAHQLRPSYIATGHIFATQTKKMPSAPQGLIQLARYSELLNPHYQTLAIGGINQANLDEVSATQVASIAVVSAITKAADPIEAFKRLRDDWLAGKTVIGAKRLAKDLSDAS
ncbi:thiamine-phosphate pyrophosphorylase [Shewanella maritima]|uniref:hydroxymethylpyrimidine kinase n=1 Tax=Shewanella maritima TaxID=2520507 RepID=A0A411PME7_9GAMM|nr:bifunctional hydroxymethylpyrimidine kinase/phosphomethylpyrimidine kinase [Shewanella maritima]QBF84712.1 thiamine-phosphate pyrophosphorylase [Shewanella maritima]